MKKTAIILFSMILLLCAFTITASAAENEIFFATDVHGKTGNFDYILEAVADDADIGLVALGGDYEVTVSSMDSIVKDCFPNAETVYISGNHDDEYSKYHSTGEAFNNEHFSLFVISYEDFKNKNAADDLEAYLNNYNKNEETKGKPLFVLSHLPLHSQRGDNTSADTYTKLLNEAGKNIDIIYLWGHNHTIDRTLHYYKKGEKMTPQGGSSVTLNFSYLTAGYIKEGYGICVKVNDNDIKLQRYDTYGKYGSEMSVQRQIPAIPPYDCEKDGHKYENKGKNDTAKAIQFTCSECNDSYFERHFGDFDGDCQITAGDARLVLRASIDLEEFSDTDLHAVDIDRNGKITAADARLILRKAVDLPDSETTMIEWKIFRVKEDGKVA